MNLLLFDNSHYHKSREGLIIAEALIRQGCEVYFVGNELKNVQLSPSCHYYCLPYDNYRFDFLSLDVKIDCVLGLHQSVAPFVADYKNKTKVPSYCLFLDFPTGVIDGKDLLNYNFSYSQVFYYWINCLLELDGAIFTTEIARKEYLKRYKRKAYLVYYSLLSDNFKQNERSSYICGHSPIERIYGLNFVLEVLANTKYTYQHIYDEADPNWLFCIKDMAKDITNQIILYKGLDRSEQIDLIRYSSMIISGKWGSWLHGGEILEAMSVGVPGVCFDYPIFREMYGDSVLYVKPFDLVKMKKHIIALCENKSLNEEMGKIGHERFLQIFEINKVASNLMYIMKGDYENQTYFFN